MPFIIGKFPLNLDSGVILAPANANLISVHVQRDQVCIWGEMDSDARPVSRKVYVMGTGQVLPPDRGRFLGTVVTEGGALIWHIYDR